MCILRAVMGGIVQDFTLETPGHVISEVTRRYGITREQLRSPSRCRMLVEARREIVTRLRATGLSLASLGILIGRDHTSVHHLLTSAGVGG